MIPILAELAYNALSDKDKNRFKCEYPVILQLLQCCERQNTCSLWNLKCCSCSDKRQFSEVYKYYSDGELSYTNYYNEDGYKFEYYYKDGKIRSKGEYKNGEKIGNWVEYNELGEIIKNEQYD